MTLPHHSLIAWQRADGLFVNPDDVSRGFPALERFELASQLRRSAYTDPASIAEAFSRHTIPDRLHLLQTASSSLAEAGYCLHTARRLGYISDAQYECLEANDRKTSAPLRGVMKSLGRKRP